MHDIYGREPLHEPLDARVAAIAAAQHGVFSRAQASSAGASARQIGHRVSSRRWHRLTRDVFRLAGTAATWRQGLMAATLAWGTDAVVSHRAAASLWRLTSVPRAPAELTVPRTRRRAGIAIVHRNHLPQVDITRHDAIPVTTPARTLIDLASVSSDEQVEEALDEGLRRRLVTPARLRWRLDELGRRPGVPLMRALLDQREPTGVPQSVFETRLRRLFARGGLPEPRGQHPIKDGTRLIGVVDFAYHAERIAIEADGFRWHAGRARWEHDRARGNALTLLGWRVIRVTWTELVDDPEGIVARVRRALDQPRV